MKINLLSKTEQEQLRKIRQVSNQGLYFDALYMTIAIELYRAKNETAKAKFANTVYWTFRSWKPVAIIPKSVCDRCEKDADEVHACERCDRLICEECQAPYNQFTQIDFTCCKGCGDFDE